MGGATGTPQIAHPGFLPNTPLVVPGYAAYMWTKQDPSNPNPLRGEGLAQHIKLLEHGHRYLLSFYKEHYGGAFDPPLLENFDVVLMNCNDYHTYVNPGNNDGYAIPDIPSVAQTVYCERRDVTAGWERNISVFTANQRYDLLWIRPAVDPTYSNESSVWFAYPELIDITDFTAGPSPVVNYPNCSVTIGPTHPNCYPYQAIFFWTGPQGQIVNCPNPNNQQISVNAATDYGTWTLHMKIPAFTANNIPTVLSSENSCGINTDEVTATVYVSACNANSWYKVYNGDKYTHLFADNSSNLFATITLHDISPNINHIGVLPIPPFDAYYTLQYTNSGITDWVKNTLSPIYVMQSGKVQMSDFNYYDGTTGSQTSGPSLVPANESILAETTNGSIITVGTNFYIHSSNGTSPLILNGVYFWKFNQSTNNLFLQRYNLLGSELWIYNVSNNNFILVTNFQLNNQIVQVDNNDKIYFLDNGVLKTIDYSTQNITTIGITGFTNSNLIFFISDANVNANGPYTSDQFLVGQIAEENIYEIDVSNMTERKCHTSNFLAGPYSWFAPYSTSYIVRGNDIYLSGTTWGNIIIGTLSIPALNTSFSNFIVKLNFKLISQQVQ